MEALDLKKLINTEQFEGRFVSNEYINELAAMKFKELFGIRGKGCLPIFFSGYFDRSRYFSKEEIANILLDNKLQDNLSDALAWVDEMAGSVVVSNYALERIQTYKSPDRYVWQYYSPGDML